MTIAIGPMGRPALLVVLASVAALCCGGGPAAAQDRTLSPTSCVSLGLGYGSLLEINHLLVPMAADLPGGPDGHLGEVADGAAKLAADLKAYQGVDYAKAIADLTIIHDDIATNHSKNSAKYAQFLSNIFVTLIKTPSTAEMKDCGWYEDVGLWVGALSTDIDIKRPDDALTRVGPIAELAGMPPPSASPRLLQELAKITRYAKAASLSAGDQSAISRSVEVIGIGIWDGSKN